MEKLEEILQTLPTKKATGEDGLPNEIIKRMPKQAKTLFLEIANNSLKLGHYPKEWKKSTIKCIPKKGGRKIKPGDFRPISNLGKLLERCVASFTTPIIDDMDLLPAD